MVRVEEHESDLYAAVDLVADKLKRKLVKVCVFEGRETLMALRNLVFPFGF